MYSNDEGSNRSHSTTNRTNRKKKGRNKAKSKSSTGKNSPRFEHLRSDAEDPQELLYGDQEDQSSIATDGSDASSPLTESTLVPVVYNINNSGGITASTSIPPPLISLLPVTSTTTSQMRFDKKTQNYNTNVRNNKVKKYDRTNSLLYDRKEKPSNENYATFPDGKSGLI